MRVSGQQVVRIQRQDGAVRAEEGDLTGDARAGHRPTQSVSIEAQRAVQVTYPKRDQRDSRFHDANPRRSPGGIRRLHLWPACGPWSSNITILTESYDVRDERAGVKFKDADLIGIPVRIAVGARGLGTTR